MDEGSFTAECADFLEGLTQLTSLRLRAGESLTSAAWGAIAGLPRLRDFEIADPTQEEDRAAVWHTIASMTALTSLWIMDIGQPEGDGVAGLYRILKHPPPPLLLSNLGYCEEKCCWRAFLRVVEGRERGQKGHSSQNLICLGKQ